MQGYKKQYKKLLRQNQLFSLNSLSLCLPSSYKYWTDLIVGGGSAGHPPAGLCYFAGQISDEGTSLMMPRHRIKKSSTIGAVCGNDMVILAKTKIQNRDWW
jgi:hypothetical protein